MHDERIAKMVNGEMALKAIFTPGRDLRLSTYEKSDLDKLIYPGIGHDTCIQE